MQRRYLVFGFLVVVLLLLWVAAPVFSRKRAAALVQKAQGEMRSLAVVASDYRIASNHALENAVSREVASVTRVESATPGGFLEPFRFGPVDEVWSFLEAPPPIVQSIPIDPFSPDRSPYFVADWGPVFLIMSVGPNGKLDVTPEELEVAMHDPAQLTFAERVRIEWSYSPTNGTRSSGDSLFLGQ